MCYSGVAPGVHKSDKEKSCQIQEGETITSLKAITGCYSHFKQKAEEGQSFSHDAVYLVLNNFWQSEVPVEGHVHFCMLNGNTLRSLKIYSITLMGP